MDTRDHLGFDGDRGGGRVASISLILPGYASRAVGGYKVVYEYANHLVRQGHTVNIVQMLPGHTGDSRIPRWRQALRAVKHPRYRHARPTWFPLDPRVMVTNYRRLVANGIPESDVIIAAAAETAPLVATAVANRGIPGFYFIQHYEDWLLDPAYVDEIWRLPLRKIVIAPWLEQKARERGVDAVLIPNGIDATAFPSGGPVRERPLQVMALVSSIPWKRVDLVAKVMAEIAKEMPEVRLKTFGVARKPVELSEAVEHVQDPTPMQLQTLYQQSRVYICASDAEGWHLPPAEAMSCGAAVVSTDIDGVRAYADGVALFSPVGDADQLARNALRLIRDEVLCEALAAAGHERIRCYSPESAAIAFEGELLHALALQDDPTPAQK